MEILSPYRFFTHPSCQRLRRRLAHLPLFAEREKTISHLLAAATRPIVGLARIPSLGFAFSSTNGEDLVIAASLDPLGWALLSLLEQWKGEKTPEGFFLLSLPLPIPSQDSSHPFFLTLQGRLFLGASSRSELSAMRSRILASSLPRSSPETAPSPQIRALLRPSSDFVRLFPFELSILREATLSVTPEEKALSLAISVILQTEDTETAPSFSPKTPSSPPPSDNPNPTSFSNLRFFRHLAPSQPSLRAAFASSPEKPWLAGWGWIEPGWGGSLLRQAWFGVEGRPVRGGSDPTLFMIWEAVEKGILQEAKGGFFFRLAPPPPIGDDQGVPPLPAGDLVWETSEKGGEAFGNAIERLIAYHRSPGGPLLYQRVRQATRLHRGEDSPMPCYLELHPLFFQHLEPAWVFRRVGERHPSPAGAIPSPRPPSKGQDTSPSLLPSAFLLGTTHRSRLVLLEQFPLTSLPSSPSVRENSEGSEEQCQGFGRILWDGRERLGELEAAILDKGIGHGWIPEKNQRDFIHLFQSFLRGFQLTSPGECAWECLASSQDATLRLKIDVRLEMEE